MPPKGNSRPTTDKNLEEDTLNDDKKTRSKKNRGDRNRQKENGVWKRIPPEDGGKKSKEVGMHTYHRCEHHMAWFIHLPSKCRLGKQPKKEQTRNVGGNSATYATAAASIANPQFQCLIASIAGLQGRFNEK